MYITIESMQQWWYNAINAKLYRAISAEQSVWWCCFFKTYAFVMKQFFTLVTGYHFGIKRFCIRQKQNSSMTVWADFWTFFNGDVDVGKSRNLAAL